MSFLKRKKAKRPRRRFFGGKKFLPKEEKLKVDGDIIDELA